MENVMAHLKRMPDGPFLAWSDISADLGTRTRTVQVLWIDSDHERRLTVVEEVDGAFTTMAGKDLDDVATLTLVNDLRRFDRGEMPKWQDMDAVAGSFVSVTEACQRLKRQIDTGNALQRLREAGLL